MQHRFDELAKVLAEGVSRRDALRRLGGALAGALLASMGLETAWGQRGNVPPGQGGGIGLACQACCINQRGITPGPPTQNPGDTPYGQCVSCCIHAAQQYNLDPRTEACLHSTCVGGGGDNGGDDCPAGRERCGSICCPAGQRCVNGSCQAVGGGGDQCPEGRTCGSDCCDAGETCCPGALGPVCVNLDTNNDHCGTCGNPCPPGKVCRNGDCVAVSGDLCPDGRERCNGSCCPSDRVCKFGACVCPDGSQTCGDTCCGPGEQCICVDWKLIWFTKICVRWACVPLPVDC